MAFRYTIYTTDSTVQQCWVQLFSIPYTLQTARYNNAGYSYSVYHIRCRQHGTTMLGTAIQYTIYAADSTVQQCWVQLFSIPYTLQTARYNNAGYSYSVYHIRCRQHGTTMLGTAIQYTIYAADSTVQQCWVQLFSIPYTLQTARYNNAGYSYSVYHIRGIV